MKEFLQAIQQNQGAAMLVAFVLIVIVYIVRNGIVEWRRAQFLEEPEEEESTAEN